MFISDTEARNANYLAQHPLLQKNHYYVALKDIPAVKSNSITGTISKGSVLLFYGIVNADEKTITMCCCEYEPIVFHVRSVDIECDILVSNLSENTLKDCTNDLDSMSNESQKLNESLLKALNSRSKIALASGIIACMSATFSVVALVLLMLIGNGLLDLLLSKETAFLLVIVSVILAVIFSIVSRRCEEAYDYKCNTNISENIKKSKNQFEEYIRSVINGG